MLRFIFKQFKRKFYNLMLEDLFEGIPDKVKKPALGILADKKDTVTKLLYYEANSISRRNPTEFGSLERRNGMLMMIQALIYAVQGAETTGTVDHPELGELKPISSVPDHKPGLENFKKAVQKRKEKGEDEEK